MKIEAIRKIYDSIGINKYYQDFADDYYNPHASDIELCLYEQLEALYSLKEAMNKDVFDLCCGDGLITDLLEKKYQFRSISGCDFYMKEQYQNKHNNVCYQYSFEDIAYKNIEIPHFDLTIISYAIDLIPKEQLNLFLYKIAEISKNLLIIRPNKHILNDDFFEVKKIVNCGKAKSILYESKIFQLVNGVKYPTIKSKLNI